MIPAEELKIKNQRDSKMTHKKELKEGNSSGSTSHSKRKREAGGRAPKCLKMWKWHRSHLRLKKKILSKSSRPRSGEGQRVLPAMRPPRGPEVTSRD